MLLSISVCILLFHFSQLNVENSDNWKEELQKYISPDQLPQAYGGTRCEPDPYCTNFVSSLSLYASVAADCSLSKLMIILMHVSKLRLLVSHFIT